MMSEQTNAYDAEVKRIAEVLYNLARGCLEILEPEQPEEKEKCMNELFFPQARAMVAEMAKQYEFAYFSNYHGDEDSPDYEQWNENCISEMIERGLISAPEVKQCDHKDCNWGTCSITNEPICGCCGAYVNTVMTEDEKKEEMQQLFDASEINVHKVTERGYLCYRSDLSCDRPRSCQFYKCCAYSPSNEQK